MSPTAEQVPWSLSRSRRGGSQITTTRTSSNGPYITSHINRSWPALPVWQWNSPPEGIVVDRKLPEDNTRRWWEYWHHDHNSRVRERESDARHTHIHDQGQDTLNVHWTSWLSCWKCTTATTGISTMDNSHLAETKNRSRDPYIPWGTSGYVP